MVAALWRMDHRGRVGAEKQGGATISLAGKQWWWFHPEWWQWLYTGEYESKLVENQLIHRHKKCVISYILSLICHFSSTVHIRLEKVKSLIKASAAKDVRILMLVCCWLPVTWSSIFEGQFVSVCQSIKCKHNFFLRNISKGHTKLTPKYI